MKRTLLISFFLMTALVLSAQNPFYKSREALRQEIHNNINLAGSNYLAYPGPKKQLTPAPAGKTPFYISHYGRHGSRYLCEEREYVTPEDALLKAEKYGKLTDYGKDVLRRVRLVCDEAYKRYGELTLLGAEQHKAIAKRMFERFPEVFADSARIDAKSTVVIRCILSMENALQQFISMNPKLKITHDASEHDMYYMNNHRDWLGKYRISRTVMREYGEWIQKNCSGTRLINLMFNDEQYIKDSVNTYRLYDGLFNIATIIQGCDIRSEVNLMDLFTEDEIFNNWEKSNMWWYLGYTASPQRGGVMPYEERYLLDRIITQADSLIQFEKPGATLRYGHETVVLPLASLLELNNNAVQVDDITKIAENWRNYEVFPMATNIQFIFYRKDINDKDILVKVLLCEDEATLPVKTDCAPYYHWKDVRQYYLDKLKKYYDDEEKIRELLKNK